jgi:hypothetical protein
MHDPLLDNPDQTGQPENIDARCEEAAQNSFRVDTGGWIRKAWELFQQEPGYFIGLLLISQGINIVITLASSQMGEFISAMAQVAVGFALLPMQMGYAIVARKMLRGESYQFGDLFGGYKMAAELIVVYVLYGLLVVLGMVLLVLPGIYLAIALAWGPYLLLFYGKGAGEALKASRKVIGANWWSMFGFFLVAGLLLNLAGALVCLVGLLVSIPVSSIAFYVAFHETLAEAGYESDYQDEQG